MVVVLDLALGVVAVDLLVEEQLLDLDLVVPAGDLLLQGLLVGVVVDDAVDVVEVPVDGPELGLEVGEKGLVVDGALPGLLVPDGALEVAVEVDLAVGEGDLVLEADLVELLVLGVEVVLLDEVVEPQRLLFDVRLQGRQLQLFAR